MNLTEKKAQFEDIISHLHAELQKLRTARANPAMVEDLQADYYGTKTPLKQLGSISVPEPRQLLISPWDKSVLAAIEKAIRDSGLGLNPANEGDKIRVTVPQLTEERRKGLTKIAGKTGEVTRVRLRNLREELTKEIKKEFEEKAITEDDKFRVQEELQKVMDEYNKKVKDLQDTKEKEIMTI